MSKRKEEVVNNDGVDRNVNVERFDVRENNSGFHSCGGREDRSVSGLDAAALNVSGKLAEIIKVAGGGRPLHKVVYDIMSGQYGFVFDDGRYQYLFQGDQDPAVMEEVKKLKIRLDETLDELYKANDRVKKCEQENGSAIAKAESWKKKAKNAEGEFGVE